MKIKRYFGTDTRKTMRQIRMEQGPDAAILSCRATAGGTEIVVAIEDELPGSGYIRETARNAQRIEMPKQKTTPTSELEAIRRELRAMHGMMQDRFSRLADIDMLRRNPQQAGLIERLQEKGFESELARSLVAGLNIDDLQRAWHNLLVRLAGKLKITNDNILKQGGRIALLGASGTGKTVTIAKLAARYALRHGPNRVALVSSDAHRIGSTQLLERYARLLRVPLQMVRNGAEIKQAMDRFAGFDLVLVDTPGLGQRHPELESQMELLGNVPGLHPYLVASANVYASVLQQIFDSYDQIRLSGIILTKIDESESLGEILSTVIARGLPIAYVSEGQCIPEDLRPARSARLVALALTIADRHLAANPEVAQSA